MASRILGMGDVLSIIEKAEEAFDEQEAEELEKNLRNAIMKMQQQKRLSSQMYFYSFMRMQHLR